MNSLFVFGIWSSAVWWIKMGWTKTGSVFFKNDWRNWISRYHFGAVTKLFIKTKFYRINMALYQCNWGCVFMVNIEKITSLETNWLLSKCELIYMYHNLHSGYNKVACGIWNDSIKKQLFLFKWKNNQHICIMLWVTYLWTYKMLHIYVIRL